MTRYIVGISEHIGNVGVRMYIGKHESRHAAIVEQAIRDACKGGIERVSFGTLADSLGMSKSGVYAHFGSLDALQLEVVDTYCQRFDGQVFGAALAMPVGLPRLRAIFANWCRHISAEMWLEVLPLYSAGEAEGLTALARRAWIRALARWRGRLEACIRDAVLAGHLDAGTDQGQLAHDLYGLIIALHHEIRFFNNFEAIQRTARTFHLLLDLHGGECGEATGEFAHRPDNICAIAESWLAILGGGNPARWSGT